LRIESQRNITFILETCIDYYNGFTYKFALVSALKLKHQENEGFSCGLWDVEIKTESEFLLSGLMQFLFYE
jgi:hypothetical protein